MSSNEALNILDDLQKWYASQCDGVWEHQYGIEIDNLDNPGWAVKIDLVGTGLESVEYVPYEYGPRDGKAYLDNWIMCKVENAQFLGYGGPCQLSEIIACFINWAKAR